MSNTAHSNNGKGRVVTPATKSAKVQSAIIKANATNAGKRVKQFSTDDGLVTFIDGLLKSRKAMPLALANLKTTDGAQARREWCNANGFAPIAVYDDGFAQRRATYQPMNKDGWRPEASMRVRLESLLGIGIGGLGYTRADTNPKQYAQVMSLDWTQGEPKSYEGSDLVYLYKVATK